MAPGESADFLHSRFIPQNGPVAPGTYTPPGAGFTLIVTDTDGDGASLQREFALGAACDYSESCYFTPTVEVPEPGTYGLMALGRVSWAG